MGWKSACPLLNSCHPRGCVCCLAFLFSKIRCIMADGVLADTRDHRTPAMYIEKKKNQFPTFVSVRCSKNMWLSRLLRAHLSSMLSETVPSWDIGVTQLMVPWGSEGWEEGDAITEIDVPEHWGVLLSGRVLNENPFLSYGGNLNCNMCSGTVGSD